MFELKKFLNKKPERQDDFNLSPGTKGYWGLQNCVRIKNGVLYRNEKFDGGANLRL